MLPCRSREGRGDKHQVVLSAVIEINRKMQWCGWVGQRRLLLFFNINFFGCAASYSMWEPQASLWPMGSFAVALVEACGLLFPDQGLNPGPMPGAQNVSWLYHQGSPLSLSLSCPAPGDPMDYSPPVSSVCGISQCRTLVWVLLVSISGDLPDPGIEPQCPALAGGLVATGPPGKPPSRAEASVETRRRRS